MEQVRYSVVKCPLFCRSNVYYFLLKCFFNPLKCPSPLKEHVPSADPEGGTGGPDPPPPSPKKSQKYRVSLQYWSLSPEKSQSYQASIELWAIIGSPVKHNLNDAPPPPPCLRCQCWTPPPTPPPTPPTKLSGAAHVICVFSIGPS